MNYLLHDALVESGVKWLGRIPRHWSIVDSRRLFKERKERKRPEDQQLTASQRYGVIPQSEFMRLEDQSVMQVFTGAEILKHVEPGDFVVSMRSFQGGLEWCGHAGCVSSAYVGLTPVKWVVPGFFKHLFKSKPYIQALQSTSNLVRDGQALRYQNFSQVPLPIVAEEEQAQIAWFLDYETARMDALIEKQQRLIALLKEKRQAVISHAVTKGLNPDAPLRDSGVEWIGPVPAHWEVRRLKRISDKLQGRLIVQPQRFFADEGVPIVFGYNIKNGRIDEDRVSKIAFEVDRMYRHAKARTGDVYTVRLGDPGATAVVPPTLDGCHFASIMWIHQHPRFSSEWLAHCMNSEVVRRQVESVNYGAAQTQFNISDAVNFLLPFPPLTEQQQIGVFLDKAILANNAQVSRAEDMTALLQERRTALISAAVTGKIDVRNWAPPKSDEEQAVA